jgi:hypothetical protein
MNGTDFGKRIWTAFSKIDRNTIGEILYWNRNSYER